MIDFKKSKYNLVLGALAGIFLAQLVIGESYAVLSDLQGRNIFEVDVSSGKVVIVNIVALVVFLITIAAFNMIDISRKLSKISLYFFLSVLISLFIGIQGTMFIWWIVQSIIPNIIYYIIDSEIILINIIYLSIIIGVLIFLVTFTILANRKVNYIRFITKEVKEIKKLGFGKTIKVKGEDELADLCNNINNMSVELGERIEKEKQIEENKHELITNISHDLKTPLTSIVGYLELLNNQDIDEKVRDEYMKIVYNKSLRLKSLVNELFQYTKLSGSNMKLEESRINISMLLNQAVGESIINFSERNIEVELNNPYSEVFCKIDSFQILRVFENLIRNAEKYADPHSKFIVSLDVIKDNVEISFINKCKSLAEEDLEKLFERFYRQDKSRSKEGAGLGLAIAQRIIELHNGSIIAEKIDKNIKFNITLKRA